MFCLSKQSLSHLTKSVGTVRVSICGRPLTTCGRKQEITIYKRLNIGNTFLHQKLSSSILTFISCVFPFVESLKVLFKNPTIKGSISDLAAISQRLAHRAAKQRQWQPTKWQIQATGSKFPETILFGAGYSIWHLDYTSFLTATFLHAFSP